MTKIRVDRKTNLFFGLTSCLFVSLNVVYCNESVSFSEKAKDGSMNAIDLIYRVVVWYGRDRIPIIDNTGFNSWHTRGRKKCICSPHTKTNDTDIATLTA